MQSIKCPCCGANVTPNETNSTTICEYCGSPLVSNIPFKQEPINTLENNKNPNKIRKKRRPKINTFLLVFLALFDIWPAIIYFIIIKNQQKQWDKENNNNNDYDN